MTDREFKELLERIKQASITPDQFTDIQDAKDVKGIMAVDEKGTARKMPKDVWFSTIEAQTDKFLESEKVVRGVALSESHLLEQVGGMKDGQMGMVVLAFGSAGKGVLSAEACATLFGKREARGFSTGDVLFVMRGSEGSMLCSRIPLYDAKSKVGAFPGAEGLESADDKLRIEQIPQLFAGENFVAGEYNADECLEAGTYYKMTLGRPAGVDADEHFILTVTGRRTYANGWQNALQIAHSLKHSGDVWVRYVEFNPEKVFTQFKEWQKVAAEKVSNFYALDSVYTDSDKVTLSFYDGDNTPDEFNIPCATTEKAGVMSASDKKNLDETASYIMSDGYVGGYSITLLNSKGVRVDECRIFNATSKKSGMLSREEYKKLQLIYVYDNIAADTAFNIKGFTRINAPLEQNNFAPYSGGVANELYTFMNALYVTDKGLFKWDETGISPVCQPDIVEGTSIMPYKFFGAPVYQKCVSGKAGTYTIKIPIKANNPKDIRILSIKGFTDKGDDNRNYFSTMFGHDYIRITNGRMDSPPPANSRLNYNIEEYPNSNEGAMLLIQSQDSEFNAADYYLSIEYCLKSDMNVNNGYYGSGTGSY